MVSKKGEWLIANRSPSYFDRYKCSVVGRGGSRTAPTGAVTMEQAGSTVGAGSARPSSPVVILLSQRAGKPRPYKTTKPRKTNPPGLVFVCLCSSQRSNRRTLFHYFSINIDRLFALTGYLVDSCPISPRSQFKFIDYK